MYLPSQFEETRSEVLHALIVNHPLATLITSGDNGFLANHIPVAHSPSPAPFGVLAGHVARANPIWREYRDGSEVLAIFQGPDAYITPSHYPEKAVSGKVVPTWDYAVVHARGNLRFIHEKEWLLSLVGRLTHSHEASMPSPWAVTDAPEGYLDKMLGAIVGFEITIKTLTGKWKVSQNRNAADQRGVIDGLRHQATTDGVAIAEMLSERQ